MVFRNVVGFRSLGAGIIEPVDENASQSHLHVIDLADGHELVVNLALDAGEEIAARSLRFSPDAHTIALQTWFPNRSIAHSVRGYAWLFDARSGDPRGRLPIAGASANPGFTADSAYFVHGKSAGDEVNLAAWDIAAQKSLPALKNAGALHTRSPTGKYVVAAQDLWDEHRAMMRLWDLRSGSAHALGNKRPPSTGWFSPDGRHVVIVPHDGKLPTEIWQVETATKQGELTTGGRGIPVFSPDSRHMVVFSREPKSVPRLVAVDLDAARILWERGWTGGEGFDALFNADSSAVLIVDVAANRFELVETRSGITLCHPSPLSQVAGGWSMWGVGPVMGGPYVLISAIPNNPGPGSSGIHERILEWLPGGIARVDANDRGQTVAILDARDGDVVFFSGDRSLASSFGFGQSEFARFSPDGRSLVTTHRRGNSVEMRCYDVPARHPWQWIIGVPAMLGLTLVGLRFGWRRLCRRSSAIPQGAPPCP
jgi:hypothetical protein